MSAVKIFAFLELKQNCTFFKGLEDEEEHNLISMEKDDLKYVNCAHCGARVRKAEAVDYKHNLIYGEHYHCRDCDPKGVWDCVSHHVDMDVH